MFVSDLCNTLVGYEGYDSSWEKLAEIIGSDAEKEQEKLYELWLDDQINDFRKWTSLTTEAYKRNNIDTTDLQKLLDSTYYKTGMDKLMSTVDRNFDNKFIITGGLKNIADEVAKQHNFDQVFATCEFYEENGRIKSRYAPYGSRHDKLDVLENLEALYNKNMSEIVYIGDGENDVECVKRVGLGICVGNNCKELKKEADVCVTNLKEASKKIQDFHG